MRSIVLWSTLVAVVAGVLTVLGFRQVFAHDAEVARALRSHGETVTVRVIAHQIRHSECNVVLSGTTRAGRQFEIRQFVHPNDCRTAPPVGSTKILVVLPEHPSTGLYPEELNALGPDGRQKDEDRFVRFAAVTVGLFLGAVVAAVQWRSRRGR